MPRYVSHCISIGRSDHPEYTAQQTLDWHIEDGHWYSSVRHPTILLNTPLPVRYVPGSPLVALAAFTDWVPQAVPPADQPEPGLCWRWPCRMLNTKAVEDLMLEDFGVTGGRLRTGLVSLTAGEVARIVHALETAIR